MKLIKRFTAIVLAVVISVGGMETSHYSANSMNVVMAKSKTMTQTVKGHKIKTTVKDSGARTVLVIKKKNKRKISKISINANKTKITVVKFKYKKNKKTGKVICKKDKNTYNLSNTSNMTTQKISYDSKTKEWWTFDTWFTYPYWYAYGNEGSKTYLKVGCKASYQIRTDNLAADKVKNCNKYTNYIDKCNKELLEASVAAGGISISTLVIVVAGASTVAPEIVGAVIAAALAIDAGSAWECATSMINAYDYYKKAKNKYTVVKSYGTKL